jgi:hypothetical protein
MAQTQFIEAAKSLQEAIFKQLLAHPEVDPSFNDNQAAYILADFHNSGNVPLDQVNIAFDMLSELTRNERFDPSRDNNDLLFYLVTMDIGMAQWIVTHPKFDPTKNAIRVLKLQSEYYELNTSRTTCYMVISAPKQQFECKTIDGIVIQNSIIESKSRSKMTGVIEVDSDVPFDKLKAHFGHITELDVDFETYCQLKADRPDAWDWACQVYGSDRVKSLNSKIWAEISEPRESQGYGYLDSDSESDEGRYCDVCHSGGKYMNRTMDGWICCPHENDVCIKKLKRAWRRRGLPLFGDLHDDCDK